jgi:hypothetical protein
MKKLLFFLLLSISLTLPDLTTGAVTEIDRISPLQVLEGSICLDLSGLKCLGGDSQFRSDVGKLCYLTRIVGASHPTSVTHVWYFGGRKQLEVSLAVKSANWRTYSSKTIRPREIGDWRVEVLGPEGQRLAVCGFRIVDQDSIFSHATKVIGKKIELQIGENRIDRLYVDLDYYAIPVVLVLGEAIPKVAVHIMGVSFWDGPPEIPVNGKVVKQVRSSLNRASKTLRIVLDLDPNIDVDVKSYAESRGRYCVEVRDSGTRSNE